MFGRKKKEYVKPEIIGMVDITPKKEKEIDLIIRAVTEGEPCEKGLPLSIVIKGHATAEVFIKVILTLFRALNDIGVPTDVIKEQIDMELKTI